MKRPAPCSTLLPLLLLMAALMLVPGCSKDEEGGGHPGGRGRGGSMGFGGMGGMPGGESIAAVPVEVASVKRRSISSYIETNGTLEAENEVNIVSRTSGPIVKLLAEEGMKVRKGQLLAQLEQDEILSQLEISRVNLRERELAWDRAQTLREDELISDEAYEQAKASYESAKAQHDGTRIELNYTTIEAPFEGLIIARYIDLAQHVSSNTALFRISDFTPLLCPIQIPERELRKLDQGQRAWLTVDAYDERFDARVLRISPVVDSASGTVKVTLEVDAQGRLRPGMFARVYLETEVRHGTLVVPKTALSLATIGYTVYVADGDTASRREVTLGFTEGDWVEILSGVTEGEAVVVVGSDGLSEGTPIQVLGKDGTAVETERMASVGEERPGGPHGACSPELGTAKDHTGGESGRGGERGGGRRGMDFSQMTPERLEHIKEMMRSRGMTDAQIEERIERMRQRAKQTPQGESQPAEGHERRTEKPADRP